VTLPPASARRTGSIAGQLAELTSGDAEMHVVGLVHGRLGPQAACRPGVVFAFTITGGKITGIEMIADPERLSELELVYPDK
jgi:hypothetical protein